MKLFKKMLTPVFILMLLPISVFSSEELNPLLVKSEEESKFREVMVLPGLSLNGYKNILAVASDFEYSRVKKGYMVAQTEFDVDDRTRVALKHVFGSIFAKELLDSAFLPLTEEPDQDTIQITVSLENIAYFLPPASSRSENELRRIFGARLKVVVRDFGTGEVLMTITDRQIIKSQDPVRELEWLPEMDEVKEQFSDWAKNLALELQDYTSE